MLARESEIRLRSARENPSDAERPRIISPGSSCSRVVLCGRRLRNVVSRPEESRSVELMLVAG